MRRGWHAAARPGKARPSMLFKRDGGPSRFWLIREDAPPEPRACRAARPAPAPREEDEPMRRVLLMSGAALMLIAALSSCGKKTQDTATQASSDSLLTANPVEQPQGSVTPQTEYQ